MDLLVFFSFCSDFSANAIKTIPESLFASNSDLTNVCVFLLQKMNCYDRAIL